MFQEAANDSVLQHDALHVQHADDDEGKSQHAFLVSSRARHVAVYGEEPYSQRTPRRWVV